MRIHTTALAAALLLTVAPLQGQEDIRPDSAVVRLGDSRERLEQLLTDVQSRLAAADLDEDEQDRLQRESTVIRRRLSEGDFHVGDQVLLLVRNESELSDTFTVAPGPVLVLPIGGEFELAGLLRSELEAAVAGHLSRYLRQPTVRAEALVRVSVVGEVGRPGFYVIPANVAVSEAFNAAGGLRSDANLEKVRVERLGDRILDGGHLEIALNEGRTFDQLGIRAGDQIVVPERRDAGDVLRIFLITIPTAVFALTRIF